MKKKGFTLIELLVVISIIAMLLAILMPALGKVKEMAQRVVCGTNCKGIGTSMIIYASDYDDNFPVAGGAGLNTWSSNGTTTNADGTAWETRNFDWDGPDALSIAASLYLLIREVDGDPSSFVCKSSHETVFQNETTNFDLSELWDFSGSPWNHVSYAYHQPYAYSATNPARPATGTAGSSFAVLADKNPKFDADLIDSANLTPAAADNAPGNWENEVAGLANDWNPNATLDKWHRGISNSGNHKRDGQNVLYGDGHVDFTKRTDVGVKNDNIYGTDLLAQLETGRRRGQHYTARGASMPKHKTDSVLVDDDDN